MNGTSKKDAFGDLESIIGESTQEYLEASQAGAVDAQANASRSLSSALARLLQTLLEGQPGWSRWAWVDDIELQTVTVPSQTLLEVWGLAWWADGGGDQWTEPFTATLRIETGSTKLTEYHLCFADAVTGLGGKSPRSRRRHLVRDNPPVWLFRFDSPGTDLR